MCKSNRQETKDKCYFLVLDLPLVAFEDPCLGLVLIRGVAYKNVTSLMGLVFCNFLRLVFLFLLVAVFTETVRARKAAASKIVKWKRVLDVVSLPLQRHQTSSSRGTLFYFVVQ